MSEFEKSLQRLSDRIEKLATENDRRTAENDRLLAELVAERKARAAELASEKKARAAEKKARAAEKKARAAEFASEKRARAAEKKARAAEKKARAAELAAEKKARAVELAAEKKVRAARDAKSDRDSARLKRRIDNVGKQIGFIGNQWGEIAEYLVLRDLPDTIKRRFFYEMEEAVWGHGGRFRGIEWDIDVYNESKDGTVVFAVEVKITLTKEAIDDFCEEKLPMILDYMPSWKGRKIYGVIAFVKVGKIKKNPQKSKEMEQQLIAYAETCGLVVNKIFEDSNVIINREGFMPRDYHPTDV